jgi:hypothetical protein
MRVALNCSKDTTTPDAQLSRLHNKRVQNEATGTPRVPAYAWNRLLPLTKRVALAEAEIAKWWIAKWWSVIKAANVRLDQPQSSRSPNEQPVRRSSMSASGSDVW